MATSTKPSGNDTIDARLEALRSDLGTLQTDVKGLAGDAGVIANERVNQAIQSAEGFAKRAMTLVEHTTSQAIGDVEHWTDDNLNTVRNSIRNQPFYAVGLSIGLGTFVGAMLTRR
jgi:ElaB/YqjD/DUF883 family membrane-anchored ribosome-binding protein